MRGFQVAPAELEGHLLDHPDVGDVCVVGIPDEFSGELPLAFVVLSEDAAARIAKDAKAAEGVRKAIMKVCPPGSRSPSSSLSGILTRGLCSTSRTTR